MVEQECILVTPIALCLKRIVQMLAKLLLQDMSVILQKLYFSGMELDVAWVCHVGVFRSYYHSICNINLDLTYTLNRVIMSMTPQAEFGKHIIFCCPTTFNLEIKLDDLE